VTSPDVQICAIAGGTGAGKTTLALKLLDRLGDRAIHLTIDGYYRDLSGLTPEERSAVNFDHPDSLEADLFAKHLSLLQAGQPVEAPVYDFATHSRSNDTQLVEPRECIVTEGIHLLGLAPIRERCALTVFIHVDAEIRLSRRLQRDVAERGRTEESVREQWMTTVAPMHDQFVQPSAAFANRVVTIDEDLDLVADELSARMRRY
jgi:uridine kinase